ncbi:hypothetical protein SYNPS1DRAFT_30844 [Syncephalis pseudoplumigaleata]|uniref:Uncharacterized protein n=1 Tax=Syncephalis pseudoplumigaleata TaxID=1712513 RepID=A0A4P9YTT9_9FUNG|nr:hypothetical protein SYNPS1DRAFT_30844 [Syncephalis pseudoplumigaleata]|eukprot:RKP23413.1 hypothetical protein SYNPS1DRAFT_30844 [Syncephalis pseudoplumigaleata]
MSALMSTTTLPDPARALSPLQRVYAEVDAPLHDYVGPADPTALLVTIEGVMARVPLVPATTYGYVHLASSHDLEALVDALPLSVRRIVVLEPSTSPQEKEGMATALARIVRRVAGDVPALRGQVCAKEACTAAHRLVLARRIPQVVRYTQQQQQQTAASIIETVMAQLAQSTTDVDEVAGAQIVRV